MASRYGIELARQEGTESRSVYLALENDGAIKDRCPGYSPTATQIWGDDDYEFWVPVPLTSVSKLAFELLRGKFVGQLGAVDAFKEWCKTHGVEHEFDSWI
jgi:hypothetical protein